MNRLKPIPQLDSNRPGNPLSACAQRLTMAVAFTIGSLLLQSTSTAEAQEQSTAAIHIDPGQLPPGLQIDSGIERLPCGSIAIHGIVTLPANGKDEVDVPQTPHTVEVKAGQEVKKGDLLLTNHAYVDQYEALQAAVNVSRIDVESFREQHNLAERTLLRAKRMATRNADFIAGQEMDELENAAKTAALALARAEANHLKITNEEEDMHFSHKRYANVDGCVSFVTGHDGSVTTIEVLSTQRHVLVYLIDPSLCARLHPGQQVAFTWNNGTQQVYTGTILAVAPQRTLTRVGDNLQRGREVRIALTLPKHVENTAIPPVLGDGKVTFPAQDAPQWELSKEQKVGADGSE